MEKKTILYFQVPAIRMNRAGYMPNLMTGKEGGQKTLAMLMDMRRY